MEKTWMPWVVSLLLFISGGIFFKLVPMMNFELTMSWDTFSALGTIAAVVVSLYLAGSSDRKVRAANKVRSTIVAARIWPVAEALNAALGALSGWVYFENLDSDEPINDVREEVKRLRVYLDGIKMQDIEMLVSIDISIASYLARSIGEVEGVIASVERESVEWKSISKFNKDFYRSHWGDALINARDLLQMALPSIMFAAKKAAPLPDWATIYAKDDLRS